MERLIEERIEQIKGSRGNDKNVDFYLSLLYHQTKFVHDHSCRVAYYAYLLGKKLSLSAEDCWNLGLAGLLHDIGKLHIPSKILYKPAKLTEEEFKQIEQHVVHSSDMLSRCKGLEELAFPVLFHHERWDGKGYPKQLKEIKIPLFSRILAIVDSFDAMTSLRGYQKAKNLIEAKEELVLCSGSQFDPYLIEKFLLLLEELQKEKALFLPQSTYKLKKTYSKQEIVSETYLAEGDLAKFLLNINNLGIIFLDKENKIIFSNPYAEKLRGLEGNSLTGKDFLDSYQPHRRQILGKKLAEMREGKRTGWYRLMGRSNKFIENRYSRVTDQNGDYLGAVLLTIDVTAKEMLSRQLNSSLERLSVLCQASQVINSSLSWEEILAKILELAQKVLIMEQGAVYLFQENSSDLLMQVSLQAQGKICWSEQEKKIIETVQKTGQTYCHVASQQEGEETWTVTQLFIPFVIENITLGFLYSKTKGGEVLSQEQQELLETLANQTAIALRNAKLYEKVSYLAIRDGLTGLYNRCYFEKIFPAECQRAQEQSLPLTLFMIDLNGLKVVNDNWGHLAGDYLIKQAGRVIKKSIRDCDYVFRYGGDEFVVLLPGAGVEQWEMIIKRIEYNSKKWRGKEPYSQLTLSLSIGAAEARRVGIKRLLEEADRKMYENKKKYYSQMRTRV